MIQYRLREKLNCARYQNLKPLLIRPSRSYKQHRQKSNRRSPPKTPPAPTTQTSATLEKWRPNGTPKSTTMAPTTQKNKRHSIHRQTSLCSWEIAYLQLNMYHNGRRSDPPTVLQSLQKRQIRLLRVKWILGGLFRSQCDYEYCHSWNRTNRRKYRRTFRSTAWWSGSLL